MLQTSEGQPQHMPRRRSAGLLLLHFLGHPLPKSPALTPAKVFPPSTQPFLFSQLLWPSPPSVPLSSFPPAFFPSLLPVPCFLLSTFILASLLSPPFNPLACYLLSQWLGPYLRSSPCFPCLSPFPSTAPLLSAYGMIQDPSSPLIAPPPLVLLPISAPYPDSTCQAGHAHALKMLLSSGADPGQNLRADGRSLCWAAAAGGHAEAVRALAEYGAPFRLPAADGSTPLWAAAKGGNSEALDLLLGLAGPEGGAEAAALDGSTPLLVAARQGQEAPVRRLIAFGCSTPTPRKVSPSFNHWIVMLALPLPSTPGSFDSSSPSSSVISGLYYAWSSHGRPSLILWREPLHKGKVLGLGGSRGTMAPGMASGCNVALA